MFVFLLCQHDQKTRSSAMAVCPGTQQVYYIHVLMRDEKEGRKKGARQSVHVLAVCVTAKYVYNGEDICVSIFVFKYFVYMFVFTYFVYMFVCVSLHQVIPWQDSPLTPEDISRQVTCTW